MRRTLVDLDGTVAQANFAVLFPLYNDYFKLGLVDEQLQSLPSMEAFEQLAEVQAFRERMGAFRYNMLIQIADCAPSHLLQALTIRGARAGVERLAALSPNGLSYCTARKSDSERWNQEMEEATYTWLRQQNFPCADRVLFCAGPKGKLQIIAQQLREEPQSTLLIDDQYQSVLAALPSLPQEDQGLLQQFLTLGAYQATDQPSQPCPVRVRPLHKWSDIDDFVRLL